MLEKEIDRLWYRVQGPDNFHHVIVPSWVKNSMTTLNSWFYFTILQQFVCIRPMSGWYQWACRTIETEGGAFADKGLKNFSKDLFIETILMMDAKKKWIVLVEVFFIRNCPITGLYKGNLEE